MSDVKTESLWLMKGDCSKLGMVVLNGKSFVCAEVVK